MTKSTKKTTTMSNAIPTMMITGPITRFSGYETLRGATSVRKTAEHVCPCCDSKLVRIAKKYWIFPDDSVKEMKCTNKQCRAEVALIPSQSRPRGIVRQALVVFLN